MQPLNTEMWEQHSPYEKQQHLVWRRKAVFSRPWSCSKGCHELGEPPANSWFQLTASHCYLRDQKASRNRQKAQAGTEHSSERSQGGLQVPLATPPALTLLQPRPLRCRTSTLGSSARQRLLSYSKPSGALLTNRTMPGLPRHGIIQQPPWESDHEPQPR